MHIQDIAQFMLTLLPLSSVPWPTSEHGVKIRCVLTWAWGESRYFHLLSIQTVGVCLISALACLTTLSQTGYKRQKVTGSSVPPPAELCLQWNQRILLNMRLLIQTFTICLALSLCLAAPSWVLLVVHFLLLLSSFLHCSFLSSAVNICTCSIILSQFLK